MIKTAVIMAGGEGTRFFPLSRSKKPKHLIDFFGDKTLFELTLNRLKKAGFKNFIILTSIKLKPKVTRILKKYTKINIKVFYEPFKRNTAAPVLTAAFYAQKKFKNTVCAVFPSDHLIKNEKMFAENINTACRLAFKTKNIITLGVKPSFPSTGYGYIKTKTKRKDYYTVESFKEKPPLEKALIYYKSKKYFFNAGMFVFTPQVLKSEFKKRAPGIFNKIKEIEIFFDSKKENLLLKKLFKSLPSISIDYAVMEKTKNILMVKALFKWSDVGDYDSLFDIFRKNKDGNVLKGDVLNLNSNNCLVVTKKPAGIIDLKDIIIINDDDFLLVIKKGSAQKTSAVYKKTARKFPHLI